MCTTVTSIKHSMHIIQPSIIYMYVALPWPDPALPWPDLGSHGGASAFGGRTGAGSAATPAGPRG
jgi:hypothetical protein